MHVDMKKYFGPFYFLVLVFFSATVMAQTEVYPQGVFRFEAEKETYVFSKTMIRSTPNVKGVILDSLKEGDDIKIIKQTDSILSLANKLAYWYEIQYISNNQKKEGFVWGGNLCMTALRRGSHKILYGVMAINSIIKKDYTTKVIIFGIKILEKDSIIALTNFKVVGEESLSSCTGEIIDNIGLQNVKFMIQTSASGEACGIPTLNNYILWTGKTLINLPQLSSVGDADIYSYSENYVFPNNKKGLKNKIIMKSEQYEKLENKKATTIRKSKIYNWNGRTFSS
jgi:hypothetical protein